MPKKSDVSAFSPIFLGLMIMAFYEGRMVAHPCVKIFLLVLLCVDKLQICVTVGGFQINTSIELPTTGQDLKSVTHQKSFCYFRDF